MTVIGLIPLGYVAITKIFTRLDLDFDAFYNILNQFSELSKHAIVSNGIISPYVSDLVGGNSVTIRFFEFIYSLALIHEPVGNGLGSTTAYARYAGYIGQNDPINMYGITQVGFELGVIPMFLLIMFLFWILLVKSVILSKDIRLLIASIFFMIFIMNGIGFKVVWFFLFVILIHKEWFLNQKDNKL